MRNAGPPTAPPKRSSGFAYAGLLFAIVVLGMVLATVGTMWSFSSRRDREAQLLWTGEKYREAIASYFLHGPAGVRQYPQSLDDLLADSRSGMVKRHLRRLYVDPVTGKADWQLERLADGAIIGVRSASRDRPIKQANFRPEKAGFEAAECYCDWLFSYRPPARIANGS
jgi:type II secretory pathway pseudopilin PulG